MENVWLDLRRSLWSLRKTPGLSIAALVCIALGIGSAVFIFTLTHGVLARGLPFPDGDRLLRVWKVRQAMQEDRGGLSYLDYKDIAAQARSFEAVEIIARTRVAVVTAEGAERMRGEAVSGRYFSMIGIRPALGRLFSRDEYLPNGNRVIVISHEMWQRKYGGRGDILGRTVRARGFSEGRANDQMKTIVGVMPAGFAGTVDEDISDFWIPVEHYVPRSLLADRGNRSCWLMAKLKPSVTIAAAQAEIVRIGVGLVAQYPDVNEHVTLRVEPVGEYWRSQFRTGLLMLTGASLLLLLIAATNIANLLLARLAHRERELTLRMALGATPPRIVQQLLTESVMLSVLGGTIGIAAAFAVVRVFTAGELIALPRYVEIAPDARVIAFAVALMLGTGILFGVVPALFARADAAKSLRDAIRGGTQSRRQRLVGHSLVILEVALTVVLLIASALMLRTYDNLVHGDLGFRTKNLLRMAITLDASSYGDTASQLRFAEQAREQLTRYPGVEKVTFLAGVLPPWNDAEVAIARNGVADDALAGVRRHAVDRDFFDVVDVKLLHGRTLVLADGPDSARVAIVSRGLARSLAGGDGRDVLGRSIRTVSARAGGAISDPIEIVGIVEDVRYRGPLSDPRGYDLYIPLAQRSDTVLSIGILTSLDPATLVQPMQQELGKLAPTSPLHWISTMEEELGFLYRDARLYAWLSAIFGASALVLAILGVYGVLANSVSRRFVELGVRMALGAQRGDIIRLVLRQGMTIVVFGLIAGAALAAVATRLLRSLLYGIAPGDPASYAAVAAAIALCGFAACYFPARRATKVEPMRVLRD